MNQQEIQRIRMLENRMRKPTKVNPHFGHNEESFKSIKSTDSKKIVPLNRRVFEQKNQQKNQSKNEVENESPALVEEPSIKLSDEEMKFNKKITDYFNFKLSKGSAKKKEAEEEQIQEYEPKNIFTNSQSNYTKSPNYSDSKNTNLPNSENENLKQEVRLLKEKLRMKDDMLSSFRSQIVQSTIRLHKIQRNEMKLRVSTNKIRLGEYISDKKGKDLWIDGTEIRQIKQKVEDINKLKQSLQKSKRQTKKSNKQYAEDPEEWKNNIASQTYFLCREQNHYKEILNRLQQQKSLHMKEYKLLYEQQHSKYGKVDPQTGVAAWPKIKKYHILGLLGKGGFSEVYKAFDIQELREVACKVHEFNANWNNHAKENYVKHAVRENNVHKLLTHPNIVKLFDTVELDQNSFCTVLEYCEGPDLSYYLKKHKRIPEREAKMIIRQVINSIRYLHEMPDKVIHYDLKPQNILFHKGRVKITDFGLCKITKEQMIVLTSQGVGTYWYLPPECFETEKTILITPKVDIWSIGVIYFEMLYGQKPFGNQMSQMRILHEGIMRKANNVEFPPTQKGVVSNESKDFIKQCLKFNVEDRMDIHAASTHRLFEKK